MTRILLSKLILVGGNISKGFDKPVSIAMYDSNNQHIKSQEMELLQPQHEISFDINENKFGYVQIQSTDGNKNLSNKIIVSNYFTIVLRFHRYHLRN